MGLSGNILVKSNIAKSKFDNVFEIRMRGPKYVIQYLYSFLLVWEKRQTLNKATIHTIVNYD